MQHRDNLHLIDDLQPPEIRDAIRFRSKERIPMSAERRKTSVCGIELRESDNPAPCCLIVCCPGIALLSRTEARLLADLLATYAVTGRLPEAQTQADASS